MNLVVKVLGTGCASCVRLESNAREALTKGGLAGSVEKVSDLPGIMAYGVMRTPALVVNEKVVVSGRVPAADELLTLIKNQLA